MAFGALARMMSVRRILGLARCTTSSSRIHEFSMNCDKKNYGAVASPKEDFLESLALNVFSSCYKQNFDHQKDKFSSKVGADLLSAAPKINMRFIQKIFSGTSPCARERMQADMFKIVPAPRVPVLERANLLAILVAIFFVYRLQKWLRRKTIDSPCEADSGPTASIRCPHGELMPEKAAGARHLLIPESLWLFILESANTVKPNDSEGCSVFLLESEPCSLCSTLLTEEAFEEDSLREFKLKQRQSHEKLAQGKSVTLTSNSKYYLIPSSWLSKWRSFISTSGKSAFQPPDTLESVLPLLKCEQHSRLLKRPPELVWRRGAILQKSPTSDELAIVTETDWKSFCEDWGGTGGVSAVIEFNTHMENNAVGLSKDTPMSEEHMDSALAYDDAEFSDPIFKTSPEVCEDCIGERESCELMKKLNYYNEDIRVCLIRGKEPPKSILSASENSLELNRRTSKRSRKTTFGNTSNFKVSGSTTIYQLKMMIWESFGIVKENQILHKGPKIIDMETATLSDMNIFPGDLLWVKDSEIHENRDIADELSDQKMEVQQAEEGFRGTLLTSNVSSQVMSML